MRSVCRFPSTRLPRVLLLGNGILRLYHDFDWNALLKEIAQEDNKENDVSGIPYAMRPEAICGVDVEEVQRKTANVIHEISIDEKDAIKHVLTFPFDAILTTNYGYEIETALVGKQWTENNRKKSFTALDGHPHVRNNTCICNIIRCKDDREIPVFHIHGERSRKHSLVLSYYSYANAVSRLIELNKQRGNDYQEKQLVGEEIQVNSWLDYFIMGEVYSVGFGFDLSEFDIWWAIERKAREKAEHGVLHAVMTETNMEHMPQYAMFKAMNVKVHNFSPVKKDYDGAYEKIITFLHDSI